MSCDSKGFYSSYKSSSESSGELCIVSLKVFVQRVKCTLEEASAVQGVNSEVSVFNDLVHQMKIYNSFSDVLLHL